MLGHNRLPSSAMRELIWQHPQAFAWTVCVAVSVLGVVGVYWSFSRGQGGGDE